MRHSWTDAGAFYVIWSNQAFRIDFDLGDETGHYVVPGTIGAEILRLAEEVATLKGELAQSLEFRDSLRQELADRIMVMQRMEDRLEGAVEERAQARELAQRWEREAGALRVEMGRAALDRERPTILERENAELRTGHAPAPEEGTRYVAFHGHLDLCGLDGRPHVPSIGLICQNCRVHLVAAHGVTTPEEPR